MNFNSFEFALFFLIVYSLYLSIAHKAQNRLLLVASYAFYGFWDWRFLGLIFLSSLTDYLCALGIHANDNDEGGNISARKGFLFISLFLNLSVLFFFKYFNFFLENLLAIFAAIGWNIDTPSIRVILPVGISFYTFQTLSYTIDVYRRQVKPVTDFADYALYVSFFPQLVAGPIERAKNLIPQISNPREVTANNIKEGAFLVYWGLFKKVFIADNLGNLVQYVDNRLLTDGGMVLIMTYAFLFQLYCDFSAYTDIARGTARMMGFNIMVNFRAPLFAPNIQETWNRWHISLTTWIRDYLYYPLALARFRGHHLDVRFVIILTFLIMGLWHGASWNYVIWGGYNGILLALYGMLTPRLRGFRKKLKQHPAQEKGWFTISVLLTFHVAVLGTLFFRARSLSQIFDRLGLLFGDFAFTPIMFDIAGKTLFYILPLLVVELILYKKERLSALFEYPVAIRYTFLYATFYLMVVHRALKNAFIYFQF